MMRRVVFYLEPVVFRDNPHLVSSWLHFSRHIALRSRGILQSVLVASESICQLCTDGFDHQVAIDASHFTACHDFDRSAYSRDLNSHSSVRNHELLEALSRIREVENPDLIVSWNENRYIKEVFGRERTLFIELGPLPRTHMRWSAYIDPGGSQTDSVFARVAAQEHSSPKFDEFAEAWRHLWVDRMIELADASGASTWLAGVARGRKIMLVPLQPHDWLTYEGLGVSIEPITFLRKIARDADPDWIILPQWHPDHPEPSTDVIDDLIHSCGNISVPDVQFRCNNSEIFLPFVNQVSTVSSNVAVAACLMGVNTAVAGSGRLQWVADKRRNGAYRGNLLAFLFSRYCRPIQEWTDVEGAFACHLDRVCQDSRYLLDFATHVDASCMMDFFVS